MMVLCFAYLLVVEVRHMQEGSSASKTMLQTLSLLTMLWRFSSVRLM